MTEAITEQGRIERLIQAQAMAQDLFAEIERCDLLTPGITERAASDAIRDLAADRFGVTRFWHKRIVRAGPNTLQPYRKNPPDRVLAADDIAFCDFGPLLAEWEADFGRTFVLGDDPAKLRLRDALPGLWHAGRAVFEAQPEITGEQLFHQVVQLCEEAGWEFGGPHAGHLVGEFPHEKINGDDTRFYIAPGSTEPMRRLDTAGHPCHWILEIHLIDRDRQIGGFHEELLDIGHR